MNLMQPVGNNITGFNPEEMVDKLQGLKHSSYAHKDPPAVTPEALDFSEGTMASQLVEEVIRRLEQRYTLVPRLDAGF